MAPRVGEWRWRLVARRTLYTGPELSGDSPKEERVKTPRILQFVFVCSGLALPADAATYDYYLQVPANPQAGVAAWTATWVSNTLTVPLCSSSAGGVSPFLVGAPIPGYSGTIAFCSYSVPGPIENPRPYVFATWTQSAGGEVYYIFGFSTTTPPETTGVFPGAGGFDVEMGGYQTGAFTSSATLTITEAVSFPPVPRWIGSIIRVSLTVAGPVTPLPGTPVEAIVGFTDINGNPIGQFQPSLIVPGQVASFELAPGVSPVALGQHTEVIPVVSAPAGQILPPLQLTAEVRDSLTGFGAVLTTSTGLSPPPASFAPQGLAGGQIMRLTATAFPTDPCNATLSFANSQGVAIGPSLTVNLSPGQSSQPLDLNSAALNLSLGQSAVVQPQVALQQPIGVAAVAGSACTVASDVFDPFAGRTWTYQIANVQ
jgi:hypothetical protein